MRDLYYYAGQEEDEDQRTNALLILCEKQIADLESMSGSLPWDGG